ncbi:MAG TPA: hypothetical protein VKX96_07000 [Chloroflexota bacterium]|nr:hypothetical protein [Chloroflexota bacterium]
MVGPSLAAQHYSQGVLSTAPEVERAQQLLGRAQWTAAWEEGAAMMLEQAVAEALGLETELSAPE